MKVGRLIIALAALTCSAEELPHVTGVEFSRWRRRCRASRKRSRCSGNRCRPPMRASWRAKTIEQIQRILDKHCLAGVEINPESRVKVQQGPAKAELVEQGWRAFLVKVHNQAGVTAVLAVESPNTGPAAERPRECVAACAGWTCRWSNKQPMRAHLSGLEVEYRILQLYAKEAGKREAS